jgi:hypothetical protein
MADNIWLILVALGPVILAAAIAYALLRRRRLSTDERIAQEEAVERLYDKPKGGRQPSPTPR